MSVENVFQQVALAAQGGLMHLLGARSRFYRRCYSAAYFLYKRYCEDSYSFLVARHPNLFAGGNILDVGANIGYTAVLFSSVCTPGFAVHAFEPEDSNLLTLRENVSARRKPGNIRVVPAAGGAATGMAELWLNPTNPSDHRIFREPLAAQLTPSARRQAVRLLSIDAYVEEARLSKIAFIKIDVQGYELPVCQGMEHTLRSHPETTIGIEYCPEALASLGFDSRAVIDFLVTRGYQPFELTRRSLIAWEPRTSRALQQRGYTDLIFVGRSMAATLSASSMTVL